jgi:hypothetical protein
MKTQEEEWKAIAECNGQYYVSSYGRVKSFKFGKERILKPGLIGDGYQAVVICYASGKNKSERVHKLVALAFIKNLDNKPQVNHKDGNKLNNHIDNLEWVTAAENNIHAWLNGLCENKRLAIIKAKSKPVIDIITGKKYDSMRLACADINEPYNRHTSRFYIKSPLQRFFYITDGNR